MRWQISKIPAKLTQNGARSKQTRNDARPPKNLETPSGAKRPNESFSRSEREIKLRLN